MTTYSRLLVPPRNLTVNSLDLYTVPAGFTAVVRTILVRNSGAGPSTLLLRHLVPAAYSNPGNYTLVEVPVAVGQSVWINELRHVMREGETLRGLFATGGQTLTVAVSGYELTN